jgi:peroxisomal enoyl-CoA hydratase 2
MGDDEAGDAVVDSAQFLTQDWVEQPVSYLKRDLLTYALGIGCTELRFTHENDEDFAAFPTYPVALLFKGEEQDVVDFPSDVMTEGPEMPELPGWAGVALDGERYIEKVSELDPDGGELTLRSKVVGVHKRGSGASVETDSELVDAESGELVYRIRSGAFLVGADGFRDAGVTFSEAVRPPQRPPDVTAEMATSAQQAALYRLSGDYNPLHIDPQTAQAFGFKDGPILHGLCTLGLAARAVLRECCANDVSRWHAIKARFAAPVLPGQTLVVEMWKPTAEEAEAEEGRGSGSGAQRRQRVVILGKVAETGAVVLNNAYVELSLSDVDGDGGDDDDDDEADAQGPGLAAKL